MTHQAVAHELLAAIDLSFEEEKESKARKYIGASGVGNPCDANLAFSLRGFPNTAPPPNLKRIFNLGHVIEDIVVKDLKRLEPNVVVQEDDPLTCKQWEYKELGGHISCHTDGMIEINGKSYVLDIKSMNHNSFQKFVNKGMKVSHHHYFCQVQMYMALSKVPQSFFIAYNKDKSTYHAEIVEFDEFEWSYLKQRIINVLNGQATKCATDHSDWRCKGCFKRDVCWHDAPVAVEASSCQFGEPQSDGTWLCTGCGATEGCCNPEQYMRYRPNERP